MLTLTPRHGIHGVLLCVTGNVRKSTQLPWLKVLGEDHRSSTKLNNTRAVKPSIETLGFDMIDPLLLDIE